MNKTIIIKTIDKYLYTVIIYHYTVYIIIFNEQQLGCNISGVCELNDRYIFHSKYIII